MQQRRGAFLSLVTAPVREMQRRDWWWQALSNKSTHLESGMQGQRCR